MQRTRFNRCKSRFLACAALFASAVAMAACGQNSAAASRVAVTSAGGALQSFGSDDELRKYLLKRRSHEARRQAVVMYDVAEPAPPPPAVAAPALKSEPAASDSITNVQEAGVDEGDIVKKHGDLLVILRRGRLFTISLAGGNLRTVGVINAFPPGVDARADWYDEMLVSGNRVIVVGYSYGRGGTEINRFHLSPDGQLSFEDAYHLRSNDYYSSRNYASRLIGTHLIYYTPLYLDSSGDPLDSFPAFRRWTGDAKLPFKRIVGARETYVVPGLRNDANADLDTLHTVMDCDLTKPAMDCHGKAVLGPSSRNFYVSSDAVYLWVSNAWSWSSQPTHKAQAFVYRLPFAGERPSAVRAQGNPTDQFSFREDRRAGLLDVLVRSEGGGDAMWTPEVNEGDVALLSIPFAQFGDGSGEVSRDRYRPLPNPGRDSWNFQNRFVGNFVLYGGGSFGDSKPAELFAVGLRGGPVSRIALGHAVERIDVLGNDAVVVGSTPKEALGFTAIDLFGSGARRGDVFLLPAASQGESRSHGFFFRPDDEDGSNGLMGLPITRDVAPAYERFFGSAASMLFLKRTQKKFGMAGELDSNLKSVADDACAASCIDWYGNARPIFADDRIFALLGYELVEGRVVDGRMREIGRLNFAPRVRTAQRM
jgi:hypothetical protein